MNKTFIPNTDEKVCCSGKALFQIFNEEISSSAAFGRPFHFFVKYSLQSKPNRTTTKGMPALTETKIQGDITRLKNKIVEAESHLKESKKLSVKLREAMEKKIQQISAVEAHTAEEIEAYRWKKAELAERRKQLEEESKKLIDDLRNEKNRKREEISSFDILQYENERLHIKLKEVSKLRYENLQSQTLEKEKKKQKDFDSRMAMEEIMRKMIKNSDEGYKRAAVSSILHISLSVL